MAGWDHAPHIDAAERQRLWDAAEPHLREARSKGIPSIGAGAIYPISTDDFVIPDFPLQKHWPRGYGMDVGWKATAGVWGAWDRDPGKDIVYLYREYKRGQTEPSVHVNGFQMPGKDLTGAIDPASRGRKQDDGTRLMDDYEALGLHLVRANNAVEAGIFEVYTRLTTGRLKMFASLVKTLTEFRLYRRDEKGHIVKENDHLMDCIRYLIMTLDDVMVWQPTNDREQRPRGRMGENAWMRK